MLLSNQRTTQSWKRCGSVLNNKKWQHEMEQKEKQKELEQAKLNTERAKLDAEMKAHRRKSNNRMQKS